MKKNSNPLIGLALALVGSIACTKDHPDHPYLNDLTDYSSPNTPEIYGTGALEGTVANCPVPDLPTNFDIKEPLLAVQETYQIVGPGGKYLGKVEAPIISATKTLRYYDAQGNFVAEARERILSFDKHLDITDCHGKPIGTLNQPAFTLTRRWETQGIHDSRVMVLALTYKTSLLHDKEELDRKR